MTISITTRGGKGSELTQSEMDTNLTNLARDASTTVQGNTRYATDAEAIAQAVTTAALTPSNLAAVLLTADATIATEGSITLPVGIMIQWGISGSLSDNSSEVISFPDTFGAVYNVQATPIATGSSTWSAKVHTVSTTGFSVRCNDVLNDGSTCTAYWFAIGTPA